ncbi:MAG: TonB-dependent receptor [Pseudomonadota bacterium]
MKHQLRIIPLAVALTLPQLAMAADETKTTTLPEVTVSASKDAVVGATQVDKASIDRMKAATSDTASLLRDVSGVDLYGSGGVSSLPVIHGLADDRLRIKVDGMDLISACGNHMNPPLSYIDPSNVESIRVFTGIVPVSVGGDSIGGAIQVNSPDPQFAAAGQGMLLKGEAGAFYRSNGNATGGNLSATIANQKLSMTYSGSTVESGNYTAGGDFKPAEPAFINPPQAPAVSVPWLAGDEVGSSAYKSQNQSLKFALRNENHLVELKLGIQDIPYQGWPNQRMDMTANDSTQVNLRYKGQYDWGSLEARAYNEHTRHKMDFLGDKEYWYYNSTRTPPLASGMPMDTEGRNTGAVVKGDIMLSARDTLRVGGEYQRYRFNDWWDPSGAGMWPDTFLSIKDGERDRYAVFGEWEARWNPQWLSQFGVRSETVKMDAGDVRGYNSAYSADATAFNNKDHSLTDNNWDLTALARYTPDNNKTYEFGYSQKTRSPNLYERYSWSTGGMAMSMINMTGDGNGYVGNLDLNPEVAHTLSATADWHDAGQQNWGLKVTPYYTYVQDYINAERCSGAVTGACTSTNVNATTGFVFLQYVNQDAKLYGLDISGYFPLAKNTGYGSFTATGMLNYVRGKTASGADDNLYNMMPLNAKLAVVQHLGSWTNTAEVQVVDAKDDVSQIRNELKTAGYGLLNLRSSYAWKKARFDVGVENVFDRFYNHPLGGAYVGQGKTMSASSGWPYGYSVPGMGRSIYAGVSVKF